MVVSTKAIIFTHWYSVDTASTGRLPVSGRGLHRKKIQFVISFQFGNISKWASGAWAPFQSRFRQDRKRPVELSITHKFGSEGETQFDIGQSRQASPDHTISWW